MKFGIREVCDCAFRSLDGKQDFYIDSAKMSTLESTSTTVYAQGGRGFSRLAAWEGEKTLTFTVEDALLTTDSFNALIGGTTNGTYKITTTDFAGYYEISASTLMRDVEYGTDHAATIVIPKAKLQSNLNIPMSPTGDPATFTFTFDAFPVNGELCIITINEDNAITGDDAEATAVINGETVTFDIDTGLDFTKTKTTPSSDNPVYVLQTGDTITASPWKPTKEGSYTLFGGAYSDSDSDSSSG